MKRASMIKKKSTIEELEELGKAVNKIKEVMVKAVLDNPIAWGGLYIAIYYALERIRPWG